MTSRQTAVLSLVAEGHDNAAIARVLACSQHTVKNVIYELMARLQVNNRAATRVRRVTRGRPRRSPRRSPRPAPRRAAAS
ncbi:helix-turn-helix transcriptional regulator [Kitasatospora nipponensis]|uniref:helix-turn-helix domain-containing protein n=1 Tax=Kitasatospora nipponensis TaxID=258049 RepID=UPI0031E11A58